MNKNIFKYGLVIAAGAVLSLTSCLEDPNESNLYTKMGKTIEDFLQENNDQLSMFNAIMKRTGYDRTMAAYGQYTCFAPVNEGVQEYLDSLLADPKGKLDSHGNKNGLTSATVEGMSDSLCLDFVKLHLCDGEYTTLKMGGGASVSTMLDRIISTSVDAKGNTLLGDLNPATIILENNEMENGYVHVVNKAVTFSSKKIPDVLEADGRFTIFTEALQKTGLEYVIGKDCLTEKPETYDMGDDHNDTNGSSLYYPKTCKIRYTLFAETDAVLKKYGINNFNDLVEKCKEWYGSSSVADGGWYDYPGEMGLKVTTGNNFKDSMNVVNMFVRYHILYCGMAADQLVFDQNTDYAGSKWNYVMGGEPYDYYETMLPHTLVKIWQPISTRGTDLEGNVDKEKTNYINRYITNNTLTDELATMGTEEMHTYVSQGVEVSRSILSAYNGYIHPINKPLIYDRQVVNGVLNERIRFDATTMLPEFINNGIRNATYAQIMAKNGGGSGARVAFPQNFFDGVVCYTSGSALRYNVKGDYRLYQADAFQGWGQYDVAVRIPPLPTGNYEIRLLYAAMSHGGMMQFYLGTSSNMQTMKALDIPLDVRIVETDDRIGWTASNTEDDAGVATDKAMHNRGYMRAPVSFMGHPKANGYNTGTFVVPHGSTIEEINSIISGDHCCRTDGVVELRRVLAKQKLYQKDAYWFRIKSVINDETDLKWQLDFIEFIPTSLLDNDKYSEDWY